MRSLALLASAALLLLLLPLAVGCSNDECSDDNECGPTKVCKGKPKKCVFPDYGWGEAQAPDVKKELAAAEDTKVRDTRLPLPAIDRRPQAIVDRGLGSEIRQMGDLPDKYLTSDRTACGRLPDIKSVDVKVDGQAYVTPKLEDWRAYCEVLIERAPGACTSLRRDTMPNLQKNCARFFQQLKDAQTP